MKDRRAYVLIVLSTILSLGHHVDHVIRGNHVGWPLTDEVTPFTYSLGVYPLIALGLILSLAGRVGPGYWVWLFGAGVVFLTAVHFGPGAIEPPGDIIDPHQSLLVGRLALVELVLLVAVLLAAFLYHLRLWRRHRANFAEYGRH